MNIDAKFEKISKYAEDNDIIVPFRKTSASAGYDFYCAEDTVIPSFADTDLWNRVAMEMAKDYKTEEEFENAGPVSLDRVAGYIKRAHAKVTLVPTGIKCKIPEDHYLQLCVRSSLPLKHWLILANGVGIIDADYYNNPDNEGHIYFQIINLLPFDVVIKKGECFGQGILIPYSTTEDDNGSDTVRSGGFGSTNE
jgi:dUTP pyrophosphatase